jgi:hypothetical protein
MLNWLFSKPEKVQRLQKYENTRLGDVLGGPKMHQTLSANPNRQKVEQYYRHIRQTKNLPNAGDNQGITINFVKGKPQMVNGHHRGVAMFLANPNATIGDISSYVEDIWIDGIDSDFQKRRVHAHILASMLVPTSQVDSPDGMAKRIPGNVPYDGGQFSKNSAGRPLSETAEIIRQLMKRN